MLSLCGGRGAREAGFREVRGVTAVDTLWWKKFSWPAYGAHPAGICRVCDTIGRSRKQERRKRSADRKDQVVQ